MEQKLGQCLFTENIYVYAILDGASIEDLPMRLFEMQPPNLCLYRGELDADLAEVAPYLVNLLPGTRFTNWLLAECWGKHWGVFLHSAFQPVELRKHFRKFLTVHNEEGNPLLFRYYDPRVLSKFLPVCRADELGSFFSHVRTFFAESDDARELIRFRLENQKLQQFSFEIEQTSGGEVTVPPQIQSRPFAENRYV